MRNIQSSLVLGMVLISFTRCDPPPQNQGENSISILKENQGLPDCEWCGAMDAPENLDWKFQIADENEPGERLILKGRVIESDGQNPAKNILIYAYHTNIQGLYEKKGGETGNGLRHGYLRGWVLTNDSGEYMFNTIRPLPYPNRIEPAHVHLTLSGTGIDEYWIESTLFKGDTLIKKEYLQQELSKGKFSSVIELRKNNNDVWVGERDLLLKEN